MSARDVADACRRLETTGWALERVASTSHKIYRHEATGGTVCVPCSPSDHRWLDNLAAQVRQVSGENLFEKQKAGKSTHKRGTDFSLESVVAEAHKRQRAIDEIEAQMLLLSPQRDRAELIHLARKRLALSRDLDSLSDTA